MACPGATTGQLRTTVGPHGEGQFVNTANFVSIPAQIFPDQEILVFEGRRWTYGQLWEHVQRIGNALRAVGVGPGDTVAVLQTNSDEYVATYFATAQIGILHFGF